MLIGFLTDPEQLNFLLINNMKEIEKYPFNEENEKAALKIFGNII